MDAVTGELPDNLAEELHVEGEGLVDADEEPADPQERSPLRVGIVSLNAHPFTTVSLARAVRHQHRYVARLAVTLARAGHPVTVHTIEPGAVEHEAYDAVAVDEIGADAAPDATCVELLEIAKRQSDALLAAWRIQSPDVVHAHGWRSGVAAQLAARELGIPVVQTFYGLAAAARELASPAAPQDRRDRLHIAAALARASDGAIALSSDDIETLVRLGVGRARTWLVPAGIDSGLVPEVVPAPETGGRLRVLALHAAGEESGLDELRWAAERIDVRLTVASADAEDDEALGLVDAADVVAVLSRQDEMAELALQAMAHGRPVIGIDGGAVGDAIVDQVTGLLVRPHDRVSVLRALRRLASDPCEVEAMGQAAHDRVATRYDWQRIGEESLAALARVAS